MCLQPQGRVVWAPPPVSTEPREGQGAREHAWGSWEPAASPGPGTQEQCPLLAPRGEGVLHSPAMCRLGQETPDPPA